MQETLHKSRGLSRPAGTPIADETPSRRLPTALPPISTEPRPTHQFALRDEGDTDRLGRILAAGLRVGSVVGLNGDLGAGKTRLVRAVALAAGVAPEEIGSPTFTLVREYATDFTAAFSPDDAASAAGESAPPRPPVLFHLDAYRLTDEDDYLNLGPEEFVEAGAVLIEWAERVEDVLPADRLTLTLAATGETSRAVTLTAGGPDARRLRDAVLSEFSPAAARNDR
ncbi:tRNA (adenosine(37)-N6)-threonylcarbamoyltransferase complex ATPase subunit type 1 TsaE [Alienimonas sp. DA493]|uniref:tRNA (adenosine(37)-N6)-threonylcarbamoyltransferase complex ATPase subunit type 1 TsaE n=1 Tax=Alienimonas sp. DA493 TaxID=3373605 RepID=UPI003754DE6D